MSQIRDRDPLALEEDEEVELIGAEDENDESSDIFSCKYCEFQSTTIEELDEHIISHDEAILEDNIEDEDEYSETVEETNTIPSKFSVSPFSVLDSINHGASEQGPKRVKQDLPAFYDEFKNKSDKRVFVCPYCGYQSMKKLDMNKHLKVHNKPVELPVYACAECPYTTRRKCDMPKHLLTHCKDGSVTMYECEYCPYATKRKGDLPKHMLCHKKPEVDEVHRCKHCTYFTRRRGDLRKHEASHDTDFAVNKETVLHNCTECGYTSKRINDLHKHVVLHCDKAVKGILKCTKCDYATEVSNHFAKHVLSNCQSAIMGINIFPKEPESVHDYIVLEEDELHLYQLDKASITSLEISEKDINTLKTGKKRKRTVDDLISTEHVDLDNYYIANNTVLEESELLDGVDDSGGKVLVLAGYDGPEGENS